MKNKSVIAAMFFLTFTIVVSSCKTKYNEFEPIFFNGEEYQNIKGDSTFYQNLQFVLNHYKVDYKVNKNGRVLVQQELIRDKELRFNYTKKALDTAWLNAAAIHNAN